MLSTIYFYLVPTPSCEPYLEGVLEALDAIVGFFPSRSFLAMLDSKNGCIGHTFGVG